MQNPTHELSNAMRTVLVSSLFDRADVRLAELCVLIDAVPASGRADLLHLAGRLDYLAERARAAHAPRTQS
ncbi:hypothetical protein PQQ65_32300 [Paraburkholderia strydomiana]|uniref:hypothetical protein n=1 Tax=Paraburkholderia strydomiana TaxID=1245417 RepID=UPI0038B7BAE0